MKKTLLLLFLCFPAYLMAQIPGSKFDGPLQTKYGNFAVGDTLHLGTGSNPNGDFKFIYQPANGWLGTPQQNYPKAATHTQLIIKGFKKYESKKIGVKYFTVVSTSILNGVVEIEAAVEAGEIIVKGYNSSQSGSSAPVTSSTADEIAKLKKLLDSGAINQAEYDAAKKKLLNL